MQLTLVRHGEAAPPVSGNDSKRPLTERGHQQAEQTAQYLKDIIKPEVFVVSPYCVRRKLWRIYSTILKMCPW